MPETLAIMVSSDKMVVCGFTVDLAVTVEATVE